MNLRLQVVGFGVLFVPTACISEFLESEASSAGTSHNVGVWRIRRLSAERRGRVEGGDWRRDAAGGDTGR
jgi:hypothetical protein